MLTLIFADDTVRYRENVYPAGSIACMAMNTSKEILDASLPLCKRITQVNTMLRTGAVDRTAMNGARTAAHALLQLISQQEPFTFLGSNELDQRLDKVFTVEAFKKIRALNSAVLNGQMNEEAEKRFGPTMDLQALALALANYYDAITLLQEHIGPFAESLDEKDLPRTKYICLNSDNPSRKNSF